ncbi:MAG: hypothetical protein KJO05_08230 [Bacteroidia bacterium]|nr:hypothetical protein [Bacteroidia bacterium]NNF31528.1 hypothetical protein [Flavobacteriaceae bacterium]MBT8275603.1 hypothetical protein [Bacteroidia bacterium]NNJ82793.1 hypothetical protein [Flavobacteriaceae bacterium]NNK54107.1 hypothetical protein [Flavobacteriaceae bacterium]
MLTSFFSKSNPVNFLILGAVMVIAYIIYQFTTLNSGLELLDIIGVIAISALLVFTILLLDFIVRKNNLTRKNTLSVFIFIAFTLMVPSVFGNTEILIAVVCCLFAMRRVFSFTSEKNTEKKILDASLWLLLASFFYFYSFLFFAAVYFAILRNPKTSFRFLFIPPIAILAAFSIATSYFYLTENSFDWFWSIVTPVGLDFSAYNSFGLLIPSALFLSAIFWIGLYRLFKVSRIMRKERPNFVVLLVILVCSVAVSIVSPQKDGSELYFLISPLAITMADYIENREEKYISEIFIWVLMLLPVALIFM